MSVPCVAAIDQGTSSTRVLIVSSSGTVIGSHQVEHTQYYPVAGQVEHDPLEIWNSVKLCLSKALESVPNSNDVQIVSIGITNQRETTIVWNKDTGAPYHKAIVWNDTRTASISEELAAAGGKLGKDRFRAQTGLPVAPYFSATKLLYLLRAVPGLRKDAEQGRALFGTIDTWLMWKLTNGRTHATDVSNASRTLLMNLHTLQWDEEIVSALDIPRAMLPQIQPSSHRFGQVDAQRDPRFAEHDLVDETQPADAPQGRTVATPSFRRFQEVPITGVLGDQNAALFGQACFRAGDAKCTYGTGAFMLMNTGSKAVPSTHGLLTTVAYQLCTDHSSADAPGAPATVSKPVYALEGSIAYSGSVLQWLRDNLQLIRSAAESESIAKSVPDNGGVYFVPAFAGLYAPHWRSDARGIIAGLTAYNTKAHVVRAALEASAFQTIDVASAMQADSARAGLGLRMQQLRVDGGVTANSTLMQFQADVLGLPLVRPVVAETTALGAAFIAGLGVGLWRHEEDIEALWRKDIEWMPTMPADIRDNKIHNWNKAVQRSLNWVDRPTSSSSSSTAAANPPTVVSASIPTRGPATAAAAAVHTSKAASGVKGIGRVASKLHAPGGLLGLTCVLLTGVGVGYLMASSSSSRSTPNMAHTSNSKKQP